MTGLERNPDHDGQGLRSDIRIEVVQGGDPTEAQAAALTAALLTASAEHEPTSAALTGWQRAALAEGVGGPKIAQRSQLDEP